MAIHSKNKNISQVKKVLMVLDSINQKEQCSICNSPLYPARLESWYDDVLVDFKFHNAFCENCGLFEYEPIEDVEIHFQEEDHRKIYLNEMKSFF